MGVLDDRVAVVTGGGAGIGEAICRTFARAGCRVVVADKDADGATRVARAVSGFAATADVAREDSVAALFAACEGTYRRLDILVNNAGIVPPQTAIEAMVVADWEQVMAVNVRGAFLCIKHAMPLLERQGGSIINMSSRLGLRGAPRQSHYCASKFAIRGLTESAAQEAGAHGIRVNSLCPGTVDTKSFRQRVAGRAAASKRSTQEVIEANFIATAALRRVIAPEEVAATALFLASDASKAITGEHVQIDAGR